MSFPGKTTVLIVGAGPTGLTAALSLFHHGLRDFVIIDALPQGQNASRSLAIHSATLEALDTIGCVDDLISHGIKGTPLVLGSRSRRLLRPDFDWLRSYTRHPYTLGITQNVTEHVLVKKLASHGVIVHRPLKLIGIKRNADNPRLSDAMLEDGRVITTKYVIGADGAHSTVRMMAGIGFSDPIVQKNREGGQIVAADVVFDGPVAVNLVAAITFLANNMFVCVPLPYSFNESLATNGENPISEDMYRIGCGVPPEDGEVPRSAAKEYIQKLIDRFGPYALSSDSSVNPTPNPPRVKDIIWSSRFTVRTAIADTMFTRLGAGESEDPEGGVVLLVGDAAHIHSPFGGQGMNLGIRDGVFLGEALMKHMHASETQLLPEADSILRDFATKRHARALEVIKFTRATPKVMTVEKKTWWWLPIDSDTVQTWKLWLLSCIPFFQKRMAWELSGLGRR
ncbi:hypothetical protein JVU11DRAFT_3683 [Chiua virens]|nr:hypothetical protein JVU11DRAFT_3683 [Chiua virens]